MDPGKIPVRADVPIYNGDPLKWLSWNGLFKALVHNTKMTSEAKMGFLHTKLSKECDRVIAGLYPDDERYAEALMPLRDRYVHPTTLKAAHLQVLKSLPDVNSETHPRPQAQAREALTVALVQAVELLDCDWFFCPKGMLRVGTKCGLTLNNGWREE